MRSCKGRSKTKRRFLLAARLQRIQVVLCIMYVALISFSKLFQHNLQPPTVGLAAVQHEFVAPVPAPFIPNSSAYMLFCIFTILLVSFVPSPLELRISAWRQSRPNYPTCELRRSAWLRCRRRHHPLLRRKKSITTCQHSLRLRRRSQRRRHKPSPIARCKRNSCLVH